MSLKIGDGTDISGDGENCLDIDKCDPICALRPLHMHTISGMNKYESVSWSVFTTNSLSSRDRVSLSKYTTLTCIIFSATLPILIIYSILICDYPMYDDPYSRPPYLY